MSTATETIPFVPFPKIPRLTRGVVVTEKIDGTNASIHISEDGIMRFGSRTRWITPEEDNYGFAKWATDRKHDLMKLGPGAHYGEWWGQGIQRNYGLKEKRFSLFNSLRWGNPADRPSCCHVVPILINQIFDSAQIEEALRRLRANGSVAAPGFMKPEGVIVYHTAGNLYFKKTIDKDEEPKGLPTNLP